MGRLQKVVRWFLDADNSPNSLQNIIISFWSIYNVPWSFHANLFRGICIKSTSYQAKSMRKQLISFAQVIKFCKISCSRGGFNHNPPPFAYALEASYEDRKLFRTTQFRTPYHAVPHISTTKKQLACALTH